MQLEEELLARQRREREEALADEEKIEKLKREDQKDKAIYKIQIEFTNLQIEL